MVLRYKTKSHKGTKQYTKILRKDPCVFCGKYYKYLSPHRKAGNVHNTVDHIHPRSQGGWNHWMNYAAACPDCNTRKGDNSLLGHLMGVRLVSTSSKAYSRQPQADYDFDPLGIHTVAVDERFVGLGSRERKALREKLSLP